MHLFPSPQRRGFPTAEGGRRLRPFFLSLHSLAPAPVSLPSLAAQSFSWFWFLVPLIAYLPSRFFPFPFPTSPSLFLSLSLSPLPPDQVVVVAVVASFPHPPNYPIQFNHDLKEASLSYLTYFSASID
ncbi:hypothetical protein BO70DRAFT_182755 [Aspergillus heteromorphus CBS 117.55]|uniref:Uncharacterized protein n=1 Tax=Aspergillus heteromorphus CBS 117.55 TaxID=1448321 RepID=A0A317WPW7_9EURO|nr:uncharacterized protein BO70DRAFT_182755 [Aspergillus heteromorphus CBS 117.55]PWY88479.1 hypothetical protein BO70DRAFT_182755 [Aspergillus heteromorphus CBS 117.55]